jgi:excisionase family DNA binding protein
MSTENDFEVLCPVDMAKLARVSLNTIYQQLRAGEIPARRIGRQYRMPRTAFLDWLDKRNSATQ